ncbi:DUF6783 domain-containing protein [Robinsoniella peoriensis]
MLSDICAFQFGIFVPNTGYIARYVPFIRDKYTAKWGVQMAGMIYQTRSRVYNLQSLNTPTY